MSKHAVVVEDGQRTKRIGRRLKIGAGIFGGMMAVGTGVAVAAWLVTGSGTGSVTTQSINPFDIQVGTVASLYPGASGQANVRVWNRHGFPVELKSATITSDSACYTVSIQDVTGLNLGVHNNYYSRYETQGGGFVDLTFTASMPATAGPECSAVTLTPTVTVNGQVGS